MAVDDRVKRMFKREKESLYSRNGGQSDPDGVNDIYLYLAGHFKMPVKEIKNIINPGGWFGGWE